MKHTKGPWVPVEYGGYWNIQKEDFYSATDNLLDEDKCPDAEANAKVAAAAPELLEALIKSVDVIKQWHGKDAFDIYLNRSPEMKPIREAIKKATQ